MAFSTFQHSTTGWRAYFAPDFHKQTVNATLTAVNLNTHQPQLFTRVTGQHRLYFTYQTLTWSFSLRGGSNGISDALPVAPISPYGGGGNYEQSQNFSVDFEPPRGCVVQTLPPPTTGTRVNVFSVTETVTGNGFNFVIGYCPFYAIESTIVLTAPSVLLGNLGLRILSYRGEPGITNTGTPIAFSIPSYSNRNYMQPFPVVAGSNVLDAGTALTFPRYSGRQGIIVTYGTFYFSFEVDYGIMRQDSGYLGVISPLYNAKLVGYPENCTVASIIQDSSNTNAVEKFAQYQVTDTNGRVYLFTFDPDPYKLLQPTIQLVGGPLFGNVPVLLRVAFLYFAAI